MMMRQKSCESKKVWSFALAGLLLLQVSVQAAVLPVTGDWQIKTERDGQPRPTVLSLSQDGNGQLAGKWISVWGASDVENLSFTDDTLRFKRTSRFRNQETISTFVGQIKKGTISGVMTRDNEESPITGTRLRPAKRPAGTWEMQVKVGEQTYPATLLISDEKQAGLTATWQSQWGEHEITDVTFKNPDLTFKRKSKVQDRQWESVFTGQIKSHDLTGTFKSEGDTMEARGTRTGAALVGRWQLTLPSDAGGRTQILRVYPDLSGLYGPISIDKIDLDGDSVTFKAATTMGDRNVEYNFTGQLNAKTLTGELTSARGSQSIKGQKILFKSGKKTFRKPDVIFVPTPKQVVDRMLELAQVKKDDLVYDLGCGDGRIVVTAAQKYGCRGKGFDISATRVKESLENVAKNGVGNLVSIERADIFTLDLRPADVITLYLLPSLNVKLIPQLDKLGPGVRIVSHDFDMEGVKPDQVITIEDSDDEYGDHTIYLWTTPLNKE
ncbi:SAM-dependent methyltransferase [Planctomycetota bacterium]